MLLNLSRQVVTGFVLPHIKARELLLSATILTIYTLLVKVKTVVVVLYSSRKGSVSCNRFHVTNISARKLEQGSCYYTVRQDNHFYML